MRDERIEFRSSWAVLVGAIALAPFLPLVVPDGRVIPSNEYCDYGSYQLPVREFARQEWLAGRFPLWIPWLGCGMPLHAGMQAALCYPLLSPLVLVFGANYGIKLSLFLHRGLLFAGQYRLARALDISRAAASFAALVTTWSAFGVAHLMEGHVTLVLAFALVPWLFLALIRLTRAPGPRTAAAMALVAALLVLAGHPQVPYYAFLFGGLWALGALLAGAAANHRVRFLAWSATAAPVGGLLACVQLLPALELARDGAAEADRALASVPIEQVRPDEWPRTVFKATILDETPRRLLLEVEPATDGLLIVADTHFPGWTCTVDGTPLEIALVHGLFRGVALTAGAGPQLVEFRYEPASFRWGVSGSAAAMQVVLVLFALVDRKRFRRLSKPCGVAEVASGVWHPSLDGEKCPQH